MTTTNRCINRFKLQYCVGVFFILHFALKTQAQSSYLPLNPDIYYLLDRMEVKNGAFSGSFHSSVKPFERKAVAAFTDSVAAKRSDIKLSKADMENIQYFRNENNEFSDSAQPSKHSLGTFYKNPSDAIKYHDNLFDFHANPVVYFQGGKASNSIENPLTNTRGVEVRGMIDNKVGFYSFMADNQLILPGYATDWNADSSRQTLPQEGFWKRYKKTGYDFFTYRGYFTFNATKNIHIQFGHDRNFLGNGYRSLILSDFANSYTFLKLNTKLWCFNYQNLFAQLHYDIPYTPDGSQAGGLYPIKYLAMHTLSVNLGRNFNLGIFESIIFNRNSNGSTTNGNFDIGYLNPIIFYRAAETNNGSPDNVNLGADFKWNFRRHFSLYGQLNLDEFYLARLKEAKGWWGNKQAAQIGLKYFDVAGINNLDLQLEYNYVRPFTFSHETNATSYTAYNQPLAHPLGANFRELIGILRYQPAGKWFFTLKSIYYIQGTNYYQNGKFYDYGNNPLISYNLRNNEDGYHTTDGLKSSCLYTDATLSYRLKHNLFLDFKQVVRNQKYNGGPNSQTFFTSLALRLNIAQRLQEY